MVNKQQILKQICSSQCLLDWFPSVPGVSRRGGVLDASKMRHSYFSSRYFGEVCEGLIKRL